MTTFHTDEKRLSQIPALRLLIALGYKYLSPKEALVERGGKYDNVLLEGVLREQLVRNRIPHKGKEYDFSEANIQEAIQKLKNIRYDGLLKTNEEVYDLITLGTTLEQVIEGDRKSFTLQYIDWKNPENNVFNVVPEYTVERSRSDGTTVRPDIVLFVNGIPLCVIECKAPHIEVEEAVSQNIRNQNDDHIPKLFIYVQLVMAMNKNFVKYGTVGTLAKLWSVWQELRDTEEMVKEVVNKPLPLDQKEKLLSDGFADQRGNGQERLLTEQDKTIYSLCRKERLLDIAYHFTLFESKSKESKKVARYQQFFVVKEAMERIKSRNDDGRRKGGIIWHTQGSGKSLTMVMLTRFLMLNVVNPRIVLVTDRKDLDEQLGNTFAACGLRKERSTSGRNLVKHLKDKVSIITTLIHKFDKAISTEKFVDESSDIFVLVDESHRTNFGELAVGMRRMLPNACYLGFTGTPLMKKDKNSFVKFGELIDPHYSIRRAVQDEAVVPLLYEGRHIEMSQDQAGIDLWFEQHTSELSDEQKKDLKSKYSRAGMLNQADRVVYMRAFDISEHYRANWQGTGFKAQLVAPNKATALKYNEYLKEIGDITSEVVISAPDDREGYEEVGKSPTGEVHTFWKEMMERFGSEDEYNRQIISCFKDEEEPEILIVVDKLLTGFDAPKNTVMYLCRPLRDYALLQAVARVNRLHKGKDHGYIVDYVGILGELDRSLTMYNALEGFNEEDIAETLISINKEVQKLSQHHSDLWSVFKEVENKHDEEAYERLLVDDELRQDFYEKLYKYSKTLGIALSSEKFIRETDEAKVRKYKNDLKKFHKLKMSVRQRYGDAIDYRDYESKIKKLLDNHIKADEVIQLNEPINIFDQRSIKEFIENRGSYTTSQQNEASKADTIAYNIKKVISDKMGQDPAFYGKFSGLIQQTIDDFREKRISDLEYLERAEDIRDKMVSKYRDDVPDSIKDNDEACAYYGVIRPYFDSATVPDTALVESVCAKVSMEVQKIFDKHWKVDFWMDDNAKNKVGNDMDDIMYGDYVKKIASLSSDQMDEVIEKTMQIAKSRKNGSSK